MTRQNLQMTVDQKTGAIEITGNDSALAFMAELIQQARQSGKAQAIEKETGNVVLAITKQRAIVLH